MTDDMYEHLRLRRLRVHDHRRRSSRGSTTRTLTVNGVSKAYAMTGWRIGYRRRARELIRAMGDAPVAVDLQPLLDQPGRGGGGAERRPRTSCPSATPVFKQRRDLVVDMLNQAPGLSCPRPEGAFYVYPSLRRR